MIAEYYAFKSDNWFDGRWEKYLERAREHSGIDCLSLLVHSAAQYLLLLVSWTNYFLTCSDCSDWRWKKYLASVIVQKIMSEYGRMTSTTSPSSRGTCRLDRSVELHPGGWGRVIAEYQSTPCWGHVSGIHRVHVCPTWGGTESKGRKSIATVPLTGNFTFECEWHASNEGFARE